MRWFEFGSEGSDDTSGPSGLDRHLQELEGQATRRLRLDAIRHMFGCPGPCPQCEIDAADVLAGRRIVKRKDTR